jgi:hypothetical protein
MQSRLVVSVGLLSAVWAGCDGCSQKAPDSAPTRYIPSDAEVVLEVADVGLLVQARQAALAHYGSLVSKEQMEGLQKELTLTMGFDPTTPEGLAQAGLPAQGRVAGQLAKDARGALWVIPSADAVKLAASLDKAIKGRVTVDGSHVEKAGDVEVTVFETQFGDQKVVVAARAFTGGYALVGLGREAVTLVKRALALPAEESVEGQAEYKALAEQLGTSWAVRMISPTGGETLRGALKTASRAVPEARALLREELSAIKSVGWVLELGLSGATARAQVRLTPEGLALSQKLFAVDPEPGDGVRAVTLPQAVISLQAALHPTAVLELMAPKGSPERDQYEKVAARVKTDLGADLDAEVVPLLTGHLALAVGLGDLSGVSFQQLMGNPRAVMWTAAGLGVKDPEAAVALEKRMDEGLKARGLEIVPREVSGKTVRSLMPPKQGDKPPAALAETTAFGKAWMFSNEAVLTEQIIKNTGASSALGGRPGLALEVSFVQLAKQVESFRFGDLPIIYRSVLARILDVVRLLNTARVRVHPNGDGIELKAELTLMPVKSGS